MRRVMVRYRVRPDRVAENPLSELRAFERFQENIRDRCDEPPVSTDLREVGSFNVFEGQT
jgi:hypothetical protein